jgi:hypothetical protein
MTCRRQAQQSVWLLPSFVLKEYVTLAQSSSLASSQTPKERFIIIADKVLSLLAWRCVS